MVAARRVTTESRLRRPVHDGTEQKTMLEGLKFSFELHSRSENCCNVNVVRLLSDQMLGFLMVLSSLPLSLSRANAILLP